MRKTTDEQLKDFQSLKSIRLTNLSTAWIDENYSITLSGSRRIESVKIPPKKIGYEKMFFSAEDAQKAMGIIYPLVNRGFLRVLRINGEDTYERKLTMQMYNDPKHPRYVPPTDPKSPYYESPKKKG